jgi:hypothetical protein
MRCERWILGAPLAALLAAALVAGLLARRGPADSAAAPGAGLSPPVPAHVTANAPATVPLWPAQRMPGAEPDAPSLAEQVERLAAARDPAKAFEAWRLLSGCAAFNREHDRLIADPAAVRHPEPGRIPGLRAMTDAEKRAAGRLCGGMTERQRQSRLDFLAIAAHAGVPGAALAFAREGPFGDPGALRTRPEDPLVVEWKARAAELLARAAEAGNDVGALIYMADESVGGSDVIDRNPLLAFRYGAALGGIYGDLHGADDVLVQLYAPDSEPMMALAKELSPAQRAAELEAARRIVERARERRKRAAQAPSA